MSLSALKRLVAALPPSDADPASVSQACKHHILRRAFGFLAEQGGIRADAVGPLPVPPPEIALPAVSLDLSFLQAVEDLGRLHEAMLGVSVSREDTGWAVVRQGSRRHTGSHYTPPALAAAVAARAVRAHGGSISRVCDPAMGSGAFLLAAARRLPDAQLFGVDLDEDAVAVARLSLWLALRPDEPPLAFLADRLVVADALVDAFPAEAFDLILGNPPYIPFYGRASQAARFPKAYRDQIRSLHSAIDGADAIGGRLNLFLLFCVRATTLLGPGGVAAMVLPDAVLTNTSYQPLRSALCRSGRLRAAIRYGDDIFPDATVGTAVVVWGAPRGEGSAVLSAAAGAEVSEDTADLLQRPHATWLPISTEALRARTISGAGTVPLGEIALVRDGLNTGSRRMRERLLCRAPDGDPTLRRCIEGRCIQPFRLTPGPLWVRYNPALLKGGREGASLGSRAVFDAPKIVYRQTAAHPIAAVDTEGLCYRNSAHGVVLNEHHDTVMWALCGYLNAAAVRVHHQTITGETRRTFPQVHISAMKRLPVPRRLLDPADTLTKRLADAAQRAAQEEVDALVVEMLQETVSG